MQTTMLQPSRVRQILHANSCNNAAASWTAVTGVSTTSGAMSGSSGRLTVTRTSYTSASGSTSSCNCAPSSGGPGGPGTGLVGCGSNGSLTGTNGSMLGAPTASNGNYIIIGANFAAIAYARRITQNRPNATVSIFYEGTDHTNDQGILDPLFGVINANNFAFFNITRQRCIKAGDDIDEPDEDINHEDVLVLYWTASGLLGDLVTLPPSCEVGPWFPLSTQTNLINLVQSMTVTTPYNDRELQIQQALAAQFDVPLTTSIVNAGPAIMTVHYRFLVAPTTNAGALNPQRYIGLDVLNQLRSNANVTFFPNSEGFQFTQNADGTYTVTANSAGRIVTQTGRLFFKTNPHDTVRIATEGGLLIPPYNAPISFRAVVALPDDGTLNGNVLTMSLPDIDSGGIAVKWLISVEFTTVDPVSNKFADNGNILMIVEAWDLSDRRELSYSINDREIIVRYTDNAAERAAMTQFMEIVSSIYNKVTGRTPTLCQTIDICACGVCDPFEQIIDCPTRTVCPSAIIDMFGQLYPIPYYIAPGSLIPAGIVPTL